MMIVTAVHTFMMMMSYSVCCCCVGDWCFNWTPMPAQTCSFSIVSSGEVPPADFTDAPCRSVSLWFMHNVRRDDECSSSSHASSSIWRLAKGHHWKEGKEKTEKCQRWNGSLVSDCLLAIFIIMIAFFVLSTLAGIPANFRDRRRKRKLWRPRQLAVRHSLFWALFPSHCHLPFHGSFYLVLSYFLFLLRFSHSHCAYVLIFHQGKLISDFHLFLLAKIMELIYPTVALLSTSLCECLLVDNLCSESVQCDWSTQT